MVILSFLPHCFDLYRSLTAKATLLAAAMGNNEKEIQEPLPSEGILLASEIGAYNGVPILRKGWRDYMPVIVSHMDLSSYVKMIRTNRTMLKIAKSGLVKKRFKLKCFGLEHSEEGEDATKYLRIVFNRRTLGDDEIIRIINSPWLQPELELLEVDKSGLETECGPLKKDVEEKMMRLLEVLRIKIIDEVKLDGNFELDKFLAMYPTRKITLDFFTSRMIYRSERLKQIEDVNIFFTNRIHDEPQNELMNLFHSLGSSRMMLFYDNSPPGFVVEIVEAWFLGKKHFKSVEVEVRGDWDSDTFLSIRGQVAQLTRYPIRGLDGEFEHLDDSSSDDIKTYAEDETGVIVYAYKDEATFIVIREDDAMLRVRKSFQYCNEDYIVLCEVIE